jgi:hypothetical protein
VLDFAGLRGSNALQPFVELWQRGTMFSLVKDLGLGVVVKQEALPFLIAFAIAEFFFKFKSFALECLAFLAVWYVFSFVQSLVFLRDKARGHSS